MVRFRTAVTADPSPDEKRAFLAVFKARLAHVPGSGHDWAAEVRPEIVAMVGEEIADRLIDAEMQREADLFRRQTETPTRGPFGPALRRGFDG